MFAFVTPVGARPKSVAAGPLGFYTGLFDSNKLVLNDAITGAEIWRTTTADGRINGVAAWGDYVVTTNRDRGTVTLHNAANGALLATLSTGNLPWGVVAADGRAYVANFGSDTVSVIDLAGQRVLTTVRVGSGPVTLTAGAGQVYVVHLSGQVFQLGASGELLAQSQTDAPGAFGIAWDRLRDRLYVGSRDGRIAVLNAGTLRTITTVSLPGPAYALTLNPGTGRVFVVDAENNRLYVVHPDASQPDRFGVGRMDLPAQDAADGGQGIAIWNNRVAIANYAAGSLSVVNDRPARLPILSGLSRPSRRQHTLGCLCALSLGD